MLFTIIAIVVIAYLITKLYAEDLKNEFEGYGEMLKDWTGIFCKEELGQEFKLAGYEIVEAFKAFIEPLKTLGQIGLVILAPVLLPLLNILITIVNVHKRK